MKNMVDIVDESRQGRKFKMFKENVMSFKSRVTNADRIRAMTDEGLAERNVRKTKVPVTGCDAYCEAYTDYIDAWETSDGSLFWTKASAVEHELSWLKLPYKEVSK